MSVYQQAIPNPIQKPSNEPIEIETDDAQLEIEFPQLPSVVQKRVANRKEGHSNRRCWKGSPVFATLLPCGLYTDTWKICYADGCYLRGKCACYQGASPRSEVILPLPPYLESISSYLFSDYGRSWEVEEEDEEPLESVI
ncbi:MAG: hypothetical protein N2450_07830 [bacterium]|nr:hypothetical protein [bacterium]